MCADSAVGVAGMSWTWREPRVHVEPSLARNSAGPVKPAEPESVETLRCEALRAECKRLATDLGKANALINQHEATIRTLNGIIQRELSGRHEEPEEAS